MNTKYTIIIAIVAIAIIAGAVVAYTYLSSPASTPISINASGATFPQPFLTSTITEYSSIHSNVQINYQGGGSGKGISDLTNKVVDFACSDAPLSDTQRAAAPGVVHIPETIGAITVAYNLPGIDSGLKLTGPIVADIFMGTITSWDDPAIAAINPGVTLPHQNIVVVHRSDGSGTTNWFTKYLSLVSETWATHIGANTTVQWPVGTGQSGNSAVAATVTSTNYAIGYIELAYALENNVTVAAIKNPAGNYVLPSLESTTAAAQSLPTPLPSGSDSWAKVAILNTSGEQAYPIVTPTYMLVYKDLGDIPDMTLEKATAIVQYIWYVVHDGQQVAPSLQYATLPANLVQINEATLGTITFKGQAIPTH
ncbi:MAG: phosphate ABC transporter substrate-binding protein PstS [Candidatus Bathyarchaeota archaeon]|nr:phosphate ABC transporter substrate-binding protein PstS [Candidatus Bathyarchaeota archaeon]